MKHKNYVPINYQPFAALPPRPIRLLPEFHRNQFIRETHDHFRISPRCCRYAFKEFQKLKFVNIFFSSWFLGWRISSWCNVRRRPPWGHASANPSSSHSHMAWATLCLLQLFAAWMPKYQELSPVGIWSSLQYHWSNRRRVSKQFYCP